MIFKKLKLVNIRSYERIELILPEGSLLLSGDIGSGKTTILIALEFALFGLQPGQKGASILKNGKDEGIVELTVDIDGKEIIITRSLKRKKSINQEATFVTCNGRTDEMSITESKNLILKLINYPQEFAKKTNFLYRFTVYTPQEEMKSIIFENPETRMNTLRHIFGIDKYKRIKENALIFSSKLRDVSRVKQGQIMGMESLRERLEEKKIAMNIALSSLPEIENKLIYFSQKIREKESEIKEIESKIRQKSSIENEREKVNLIFMTKKDSSIRLKKEIERLKIKIENTEKDFDNEKLSALVRDIEEKIKIKEKINSDIIESSIKIRNIGEKKAEITELIDTISNLKVCPTCLQQVSMQHKSNLFETTRKNLINENEEMKKITIEYEKNKKFLEEISKEIINLKEQRLKMQEQKIRILSLDEDKKGLEDYKKQLTNVEKDISMLSEQLKSLENMLPEFKKFEKIFEIKTFEYKELSDEHRKYEIKKAEKQKEKSIMERDIAIAQREIDEKEKIKNELFEISEIEKWISNDFMQIISFIEKNVLIKLREEFSSLFKKWFSLLVPDNFEAVIDDNFTPIIEQQGYEIEYSFLSGGEKTAVALAYRLALNQIINTIFSEIKTKGVVILDEPTDGFSESQIDRMRDVFQQLDLRQLIIVSHDQKIESFVNNIIKFKKERGVSLIEQP
jgi:DNA repair protein SbcC/Rad50